MKPLIEGLQIAIDGPAGSGKGTMASQLAAALGLPVLDTGLLYRFAAWQCLQQAVAVDDEYAVLNVLEKALPRMQWRSEGVFFDAKDCTSTLRGEDVGLAASKVAALPAVRRLLLDVQQQLAKQGCVMDGRDIGTVVLPQAHVKFFLTASLRERARRRWLQLDEQQRRQRSMDDLVKDMTARDTRDSKRQHAPLQRANDAIVIDSTTMRPDEVLDRMLRVLQRRGLAH